MLKNGRVGNMLGNSMRNAMGGRMAPGSAVGSTPPSLATPLPAQSPITQSASAPSGIYHMPGGAMDAPTPAMPSAAGGLSMIAPRPRYGGSAQSNMVRSFE